LSPVALTRHYLDRIAALESRLHAYVLVTGDHALAEARTAEAEIAGGHWRGPLHGIPIAIKDIYDTAGVPTTCHSRVLLDNVPAEDAESVRRLKNAGAIVLGKLGTDEFAIGGGSPNPPFPEPRNPWNTAHTPGGSSSGAGVGVAAGLCAGARGSDTGGSIRSPSSACGITGLKPTYGLVSRRGMAPLAQSADTGGPMAWTSEDCALLLQALAGYDPRDPASVDTKLPDYRLEMAKPLTGLRIGVPRNLYAGAHGAAPATVALIDAALKTMSDLGFSVTEIELPDPREFHACSRAILSTEMFAIHAARLRSAPELYGCNARARIYLGALITAEEYYRAQRNRRPPLS
jgi:aspartyl-tRNA(Asn)/glutamyl-tRNA(Gln) amidotransferase subunit A